MQGKPGYLQSLKITHGIMLGGQVVMLVLVLYLVLQHSVPPVMRGTDRTLQVIALLLSFAAVAGSAMLFKNRLAAINTAAGNAVDKTYRYRKACIRKWAIIEAAETFCVICFYLAGNYAFAALAVALMGYFALQGANKIKIMLQLQLSEQEVDALQ